MENKKKKGYVTTIGEIFDQAKKGEEKEKKKEESNTDDKQILSSSDSTSWEDDIEEFKKKYIERPDIQESINIAVDQVNWEIKANLVQNRTN